MQVSILLLVQKQQMSIRVSFVVALESPCRLFSTLQTVDRQAPLSTGFPSKEYWNGFPFPSPGDILDPGIELVSPALAGRLFTPSHLGSPRDTFNSVNK